MAAESKSKKYFVLVVLCVAWFLGYCDKMAINVAAIPISKEFGLNPTQIGVIISAFAIGMAITAIFGGYFADKWGSQKVLVTVIAVWSLFSGLTGVATSLTAFMVIRLIYGGAEGCFPPASSVTVAENFSNEKRGRAKSILLASGQLGTAFSSLIAAYFVSIGGWKTTFYIFGAVGLLDALVLAIVNRQSTKATVSKTEKPKANKVPLKEALKNPVVWKTPILNFGLGFLMWGFGSWMPQYWVNIKHMNVLHMGQLSMIPSLTGCVSMLISGFIIDKFFAGREKILILISLVVCGTSIFLMYGANNIGLGFTYYSLSQLGLGLISPCLYAMVLKYAHGLVGTATGLIAFGSSMAGIISPIVMGYAITLFHGSYAAVFGLIVVIIILCFGLTLTISTKKQATEIEVEKSAV